MPIYEYKALDQNGKLIRSILEADSQKTVRAKLKKNGLTLTEISEKNTAKQSSSGGSFFQKIKLNEVSQATRQLASLVKANIPLIECLNSLIEQVENEKLKIVLSTVRQDVNEGASFGKALAKHPKVFNNIYVNMIEAGESSGNLPLVLLRLADFQESQVKLTNKVTSALLYPILMMAASFGLLIAIFIFVIPKLVSIFESMNKPMPIQTRILLSISNFLVDYWWLVFALMFFAYTMFNRFIKTPGGRRKWDSFKLKIPIIGPLIRMIAISRFASTMATLLTGGVPIIGALHIVKNVVANTLIMEALTQAQENITEGQSIAEPLRRSGQFYPVVIHMIAIGEKTGELPEMLKNLSDNFEEQVSVKIEGMTALVEPALIIFMGILVGGIVFSIFVPLLQLNDFASG